MGDVRIMSWQNFGKICKACLHNLTRKYHPEFKSFDEFRKDLDSIKQEANQTKKDLSNVAKDVEEIMKGLEFQSVIISKHKRDQEDNLTRLQSEVDVKIKELIVPRGHRHVCLQSGWHVLCDFLGTVKADSHECVIRTGKP